ncbi:MAG: hypothetical protein ACPGED_11550, partial [Flavobacteriales bacterium]
NLLVSEAEGMEIEPEFNFLNFSYQGTWMMTSRIGSPTFKKNEFGFNMVAGHIASTTIAKDLGHIRRVGVDWVYKLRERLKVVNQVMVGETASSSKGLFRTVNTMNNIDYYSGRNWMISLSNSFNYNHSMENSENMQSWSLAGSVTYVISPHTRLRLNTYSTRIRENNERQKGVLLQFVTGLGKRP